MRGVFDPPHWFPTVDRVCPHSLDHRFSTSMLRTSMTVCPTGEASDPPLGALDTHAHAHTAGDARPPRPDQRPRGPQGRGRRRGQREAGAMHLDCDADSLHSGVDRRVMLAGDSDPDPHVGR